jgi:hypothetical protein
VIEFHAGCPFSVFRVCTQLNFGLQLPDAQFSPEKKWPISLHAVSSGIFNEHDKFQNDADASFWFAVSPALLLWYGACRTFCSVPWWRIVGWTSGGVSAARDREAGFRII